MRPRRAALLEAGAFLLLLGVRLGMADGPVWRDWVAVVLATGAALALGRTKAARGMAVAASAAYLLGLYVHGQGRFVLALWGAGP